MILSSNNMRIIMLSKVVQKVKDFVKSIVDKVKAVLKKVVDSVKYFFS